MRRILRLAVLLCLASALAAYAQDQDEDKGKDLFDIKPMADGVYAAIAKPAPAGGPPEKASTRIEIM